MNFVFDGDIRKAWFLGKRELRISAQAELSETERSSPQLRPLLERLISGFSRIVSPHLFVGEARLGQDEFQILPVLSRLSKNSEEKYADSLRLRNLRGLRDPLGKSERETLFSVKGVVQLGEETDPEDEENGLRQEEFRLSLETKFQTFVAQGGIEYRFEYQQRIPAELRDAGPLFLSDLDVPTEISEFQFSCERFSSSSFGMSLGLVPKVAQSTLWSFKAGILSLAFRRELEAEDSVALLAELGEIVEFDRALSSHGLYTGFIGRCLEYLESKSGH